MTRLLVELYDRHDLEKNIYQVFVTRTDDLLYVSREEIDENDKFQLRRFMRREAPHLNKIRFVQLNNLELTSYLNQELSQYEEVLVDLNGGDALLSASLYRWALSAKTEIIAIDERRNVIQDWTDEGITEKEIQLPILTLEQIIQLHGGAIVSSKQGVLQVNQYPYIEKIARRALRFQKKWYHETQYFALLHGENDFISAPKKFEFQHRLHQLPRHLFDYMIQADFIRLYQETKTRVDFAYLSQDAELLFRSKGYILELYLYMQAVSSKIFDECHLGMVIDWDGIFSPEHEVQNEIDLVLRKGRKTVFVSCKMTDATPHAVNELDLYAEHFMGEDCIKVFACVGEVSTSYANRCREYGIILMGEEEVHDFVGNLKKYL